MSFQPGQILAMSGNNILEADPEQVSQLVVWPSQVGCPVGPNIHAPCVLMCFRQHSKRVLNQKPFGEKFCQQLLDRLHRSRESSRKPRFNDDDGSIDVSRLIRTPLRQKENQVLENKPDSPKVTPSTNVENQPNHSVSTDITITAISCLSVRDVTE